MVTDVLGQGWATPIRLGQSGDIATASGEEKVRESIHLILSTRRGERVMRPDFGAGLEDFVFEPVSTTTMTLIRQRVLESLVIWEPRVDITDVEVSVADRRSGKLQITIGYGIRATNTFYNLVYPFFLQEAEST